MKQLFVKICGITRAQDAELAAGLGASALGFVFWPDSPRYVSAGYGEGDRRKTSPQRDEGRCVRR